jgi:hypothetical protein
MRYGLAMPFNNLFETFNVKQYLFMQLLLMKKSKKS